MLKPPPKKRKLMLEQPKIKSFQGQESQLSVDKLITTHMLLIFSVYNYFVYKFSFGKSINHQNLKRSILHPSISISFHKFLVVREG